MKPRKFRVTVEGMSFISKRSLRWKPRKFRVTVEATIKRGVPVTAPKEYLKITFNPSHFRGLRFKFSKPKVVEVKE